MAFPTLVFEMQSRAHTSHLTSGIIVFWTIDIFMVSILAALVKLDAVATIVPAMSESLGALSREIAGKLVKLR